MDNLRRVGVLTADNTSAGWKVDHMFFSAASSSPAFLRFTLMLVNAATLFGQAGLLQRNSQQIKYSPLAHDCTNAYDQRRRTINDGGTGSSLWAGRRSGSRAVSARPSG